MSNPYGQMPADHIEGGGLQACTCFQCNAEINEINNAMQARANGLGQNLRTLNTQWLTREQMEERFPSSTDSASESHD
jgi:hypothetical protein